MPNFEWNVDYHAQQIAMIIEDRNEAILSRPVWELTYTDTYMLHYGMRQIQAQNDLLIIALREHQQSAPKSKLSKILAILRS